MRILMVWVGVYTIVKLKFVSGVVDNIFTMESLLSSLVIIIFSVLLCLIFNRTPFAPWLA